MDERRWEELVRTLEPKAWARANGARRRVFLLASWRDSTGGADPLVDRVAEHLTVEGDLAVYALARKSPLVMRLAEVAGSCIFARSA